MYQRDFAFILKTPPPKPYQAMFCYLLLRFRHMIAVCEVSMFITTGLAGHLWLDMPLEAAGTISSQTQISRRAAMSSGVNDAGTHPARRIGRKPAVAPPRSGEGIGRSAKLHGDVNECFNAKEIAACCVHIASTCVW